MPIISFKTRHGRVRFKARAHRPGKVPKHLKPYLFKPGRSARKTRTRRNPGGELMRKPRVGDYTHVRGEKCRIIKVYRAGTIDVASIDGKYHWRVTGLGFR